MGFGEVTLPWSPDLRPPICQWGIWGSELRRSGYRSADLLLQCGKLDPPLTLSLAIHNWDCDLGKRTDRRWHALRQPISYCYLCSKWELLLFSVSPPCLDIEIEFSPGICSCKLSSLSLPALNFIPAELNGTPPFLTTSSKFPFHDSRLAINFFNSLRGPKTKRTTPL